MNKSMQSNSFCYYIVKYFVVETWNRWVIIVY